MENPGPVTPVTFTVYLWLRITSRPCGNSAGSGREIDAIIGVLRGRESVVGILSAYYQTDVIGMCQGSAVSSLVRYIPPV